MKRVYLWFTIFAQLIILSSCSHNSNKYEIIVNPEIDKVSITIGATTNVKVEESEHQFNSETTRAGEGDNANIVNVSPEITSMPDSLTAYLVADESKGQYTQGEIVDIIVLKNKKITTTNGIQQTAYSASDSVPAMKCKIYVTNYRGIKETLNHYFEASISNLPEASQKLYLYGESNDDINFSATRTAEVNISNLYAAVCIRDAYPVTDNPVPEYMKENDKKETFYYYKTDSTNTWYYLYILCPSDGTTSISTNTEVNLKDIPEYADKEYILNKQIMANNIYTYTFHSKTSNVNSSVNIIVNGFSGTSNNVINVLE